MIFDPRGLVGNDFGEGVVLDARWWDEDQNEFKALLLNIHVIPAEFVIAKFSADSYEDVFTKGQVGKTFAADKLDEAFNWFMRND